MKQQILVAGILIALLSGCGVTVKHHWGFMGPDTWEATDGNISVYSYRGECWEAEAALWNLADRANAGDFDWKSMTDEKMREAEFKKSCDAVSAK